MPTKSEARRLAAQQADAPVEAVTGEAEPPQRPSGEAHPKDLQVPSGVQQFDPEPPKNDGSNIVTIVPTSNGVVTVPSGASFQLAPGVPVRMRKGDADFLSESGYA
jgi:hypothetical protein